MRPAVILDLEISGSNLGAQGEAGSYVGFVKAISLKFAPRDNTLVYFGRVTFLIVVIYCGALVFRYSDGVVLLSCRLIALFYGVLNLLDSCIDFWYLLHHLFDEYGPVIITDLAGDPNRI